MRVRQIRSSQLSSDSPNIFEYLVDKNLTWITEDRLRVSLSPKMLSTLKASFPHPLSRAQSEVHLDDNQDWEVRKITGKEDIDGVLHYLVDWSPTLVPEHSLGHAQELVDEFEARLRAKRGFKNGRGRPGLKWDERMVVEADVSGRQQKRPRGRPREQT